MEVSQNRQRVGRIPRWCVVIGKVVELPPRLDEIQQVGVGAGEGRRAERGNDGDLIGRIVYGAEAVQQVSRFLRFVD